MKKLLGLSLLIFLFLLSCAPKKAPSVVEPGPIPPGAIPAPEKVGWEKVLSEAKKEGKVVIYGTLGGETTSTLGKAFREKFGIAAEYISGRGAEAALKLLTERKAGLYLADLWQGGATSATTLMKPAKAFDPLEPALLLPEVKDPKFWKTPGGEAVDKLNFVDRDRIIFPYLLYAVPPLAININLVKREEITSYYDLLQPRWKGKIVMQDPSSPGTAIVWFGVVSELILDLDYIRQLAKQEPVILRDRWLQVLWLAQGKFPLALAPQSDTLATFQREGAPIRKHDVKEGTHVAAGSGHMALINQASHPNAARLYLNWILGREAQTLHSKTSLLPSARADVATEGLDPFNLPKPGVKYFNSNTEDFILKDPERWKAAREIFGHLIR